VDGRPTSPGARQRPGVVCHGYGDDTFPFGLAIPQEARHHGPRRARSRSSIYVKLIDVLGEEDANTLMSEFPASEADELVTRQFLRAELAERFHQQTLWLGGVVAGATALIIAAIPLLS
jgi:hypothetical protein